MKKRESKNHPKKENIYNIPNPLSLLRIIISPFLIYMVYIGQPLWIIALVFVFAAFTDFLDGYIARKYDQVTTLGRKLDIIADRILMISLVVTLFSYLHVNNILNSTNSILFLMLMSREILSAPFFLFALIEKRRPIPHARFAGKLTTTLQGFAFPMVILNWNIAIYFVIATFIAGFICAGYYAYDALIRPNNDFQKKMDEYYQKLYS